MIESSAETQRVDKLKSHMVGKTIKRIDESSVNCLNIEFTDGTELLLEVEAAGHGLYTNVGYVRKT